MRKNIWQTVRLCVVIFTICITTKSIFAQAQFPISDHQSSYLVTSFAEDSKGYIWMGTNHGLNRFSGANYYTYYAASGDKDLNNDNIWAMCMDEDGKLWVSTECGLNIFEHNQFRHTNEKGFNPSPCLLPLDKNWMLMSDREGIWKINKKSLKKVLLSNEPDVSLVDQMIQVPSKEVWVTKTSGNSPVYVFDRAFKHRSEIPHTQGCQILHLDNHKKVWCVVNQTIRSIDPQTKKEQDTQQLNQWINNHKIHFIKNYKKNQLLIGVQQVGLLCYDLVSKRITPLYPQEKLSANTYVCMVDSHHRIWLSDQTNAVQYYSENNVYENISFFQKELSSPPIWDLHVDNQDNVWFRTIKDIACYNPKSGKLLSHQKTNGAFFHLFIDSQNKMWVVCNLNTVQVYTLNNGSASLERTLSFKGNVFSVCEDKQGRIWITLSTKFAMIDKSGEIQYKYAPTGISFSQLRSTNNRNRMLLYTINNGLYEFGDDQLFKPLSPTINNPSCALIDSHNNYWIGTYNQGLYTYQPQSKQLTLFNDSTSTLIDNNLKAIIEDKKGNIWFSMSTHIGKYNPLTHTISYIYDDNFRYGKLYASQCVDMASDGTLFFGGSKGITMVHPQKQTSTQSHIPLNLDAVLVNSKIQHTSDSIINLSYKENNLTLWFSGLLFEDESALNYAYQLVGYEDEWHEVGNRKVATYTNLPSGNYLFKVKVRKGNGDWCQSELIKAIYIHPPFWASNLAIFIYWMMGLALIALIIHFFINWRMQQERLHLAEREKEMNEEHIDFFTNVSHEFRTPLSLIYAPLQQLLKSNRIEEQDKQLLNVMQHNTQRLIKLSEQILKSGKKELEEKQLQVKNCDVAGLLQSLTNNFNYMAYEKNITLKAHLPEKFTGYFDADKIENIMINLIGNALKYTPDGGAIEIRMQTTSAQHVMIEVADTGVGISPEKRAKLFNRFERLDIEKKQPSIMGNGIGLNYAQYLAHVHHGNIAYQENQPHGSIFSVELPYLASAYLPDEVVEQSTDKLPALDASPQTYRADTSSILIAEDNEDVRTYLRTLLQSSYNVTTARDGGEAFQFIQLNQPDLIVSDVVMPHTDGLQLCQRVKAHPVFGHIPFVLLTAKANIDDSIKGLEHGADAYVGKPFDPYFLQAQIASLIANRGRIQTIIRNLTPATLKQQELPADELKLSEADSQFIKQLHSKLDENLSHEDFNVNALAKELCMSYSSLYARLKALTGETPQAFVQTYKMNIAMELIKTKKHTISEVCFMVGASSLANFSRTFKRQFGIPPSAV